MVGVYCVTQNFNRKIANLKLYHFLAKYLNLSVPLPHFCFCGGISALDIVWILE